MRKLSCLWFLFSLVGVFFLSPQTLTASSVISCDKVKDTCLVSLKDFTINDTVIVVDSKRKGSDSLVAEGWIIGVSKNGLVKVEFETVYRTILKQHKVLLKEPADQDDYSGAFSASYRR